jgi:hypothetical protein
MGAQSRFVDRTAARAFGVSHVLRRKVSPAMTIIVIRSPGR